jgi:hypothetical protein
MATVMASCARYQQGAERHLQRQSFHWWGIEEARNALRLRRRVKHQQSKIVVLINKLDLRSRGPRYDSERGSTFNQGARRTFLWREQPSLSNKKSGIAPAPFASMLVLQPRFGGLAGQERINAS